VGPWGWDQGKTRARAHPARREARRMTHHTSPSSGKHSLPMASAIRRFATTPDDHDSSGERPAKPARAGSIRIVPAVPHIDQVGDTAPPWTVPEDHDPEAVSQGELVVPMTSPSRLAEVSTTDAPRLEQKDGEGGADDQAGPPP